MEISFVTLIYVVKEDKPSRRRKCEGVIRVYYGQAVGLMEVTNCVFQCPVGGKSSSAQALTYRSHILYSRLFRRRQFRLR